MKLTKSQRKILESIEKKLKRSLLFYEKNKEEGYRNILRLIIAERIRGTKHILPLRKVNINNSKDERAIIVEKITQNYSFRMAKNIKEQQNINGQILEFLKGRPRKEDKLKITRRKGMTKEVIARVNKSLKD